MPQPKPSIGRRTWTFRPLTATRKDSFGDTWSAAVKAHGSVYHHLDYLRAAECDRLGQVLCGVFPSEHGSVFRAIQKRPLPAVFGAVAGASADIISPFEYGGPIALPRSPDGIGALVDESELAFEHWCREQGIVSEFVRFDPLIGNANAFSAFYECSLSCRNVVIDLSLTEASLYESYSPSLRRNCRKAQRAGVTVTRVSKTRQNMDCFRSLYHQSMRRAKARSYYDFNEDYFRSLERLPDTRLSLYLARLGDSDPLAGLLILRDDRYAHSHLLGSSPQGNALWASGLLYHGAAIDLKAAGVKYLHMGGAAAGQTGVYEFKRRFSESTVDYFVGRRVFLQDVYLKLCQAANVDPDDRFFPPYRLRIPRDNPDVSRDL